MLQPLHEYVLLKKEEETKTTASGIILSASKEKSVFAVVQAIGEGVEKPGYAKGDRVLYREYAGTNVTVDGEDYIVIKDEDIIAKA